MTDAADSALNFICFFFFFNDTATTEIYTLSLHDALPIWLRLSSAQTRWGSASADGMIRLNWRLIHFSPALIDYVVAHELAHLKEMNHSPRFWAVVRSVFPEYELARDRLKQAVLPLMDEA